MLVGVLAFLTFFVYQTGFIETGDLQKGMHAAIFGLLLELLILSFGVLQDSFPPQLHLEG